MSGVKGHVKTGKVSIGTDADDSDGFTERMLMSLVMDVSQLHETVERVKIQVFTLAREKGIKVPKD